MIQLDTKTSPDTIKTFQLMFQCVYRVVQPESSYPILKTGDIIFTCRKEGECGVYIAYESINLGLVIRPAAAFAGNATFEYIGPLKTIVVGTTEPSA